MPEKKEPKIEVELNKYISLIKAKLQLDKICLERKNDPDTKNQAKKDENLENS